MQQIGDILAELREERGLTQIELAKTLHISNSSVSAYEKNQRIPNIEVLIAFAEIFDVTTDYLLGRASRSFTPSILTKKFTQNTTYGFILESLDVLDNNQKNSAAVIISDMRFCAETKNRIKQSGNRK